MKDSNQTNPSAAPQVTGFSPWQWLKTKNISYLTIPLLIMATVTEFVILATGWRYQQVVCLPQGMGVTFFGIGPIGATILAVELLKLPLATVRAWLDQTPELAVYRFAVEEVFRLQAHVLDEHGEKLLALTERIGSVPKDAYAALSTADARFPTITL